MVSHAGIVNTFVRKQLESGYILSTSGAPNEDIVQNHLT